MTKETQGFTPQEEHFFAQGEDTEAMEKSPEERVSDVYIAQKEREQGHIEAEVFLNMEVAEIKNLVDSGESLGAIEKSPMAKVAFLREVVKQLEAKKEALEEAKIVDIGEIKALEKKIEDMEDLQVQYGLEIDLGDEEQEESLAA